MKVLYIANKGEVGGATKSLLTLVTYLKEKNITPIVLSPVKNGVVMNYCKKNNIEAHHVKYYKISYSFGTSKYKNLIKIILSPIYSIYTYIMNLFAIKKIGKLVDMSTVNFIHTNLNRDEIGIMLSKKYQIKHIVHLREYGTLDFKCKYFRPNYYQYFNKNTNQFIAISESIKNFYVSKGTDKQKINVIYNGVQNTIPSKKYNNNNNDNIKIVILSGISKEKGQIQVIKAISKISSKLSQKIDLYLYGKCESLYQQYLINIINGLNLTDNIHFLGYKDNVYDELKEYDIAITPSKSEAFGRVTVEYMLAKLPVIVSNTGANTEIIINNQSGLVYNYEDIDDLADKIIKLVNSFELRKQLSEKGYKRAIDFFTAEKNATNIYNLYQKMYRSSK